MKLGRSPMAMLVVALLSVHQHGLASQGKSAVAEEVAAVERRLVRAMVGHDAAALRGLLADDLVFIHGGGNAEGKAQTVARLAGGEVVGIDLGSTKIRAATAEVIVAIHERVVIHTRTSPPRGDLRYLSHVWRKTRGQWQLAHRQATIISRCP